MTKLQLYRPLSDAEPNMAEDSATGQFYWAADADTEIEALIRERHQLRNELTAARLENQQRRALLVEVYNHGENSELHGRIGAALGAAPGEDASPVEPGAGPVVSPSHSLIALYAGCLCEWCKSERAKSALKSLEQQDVNPGSHKAAEVSQPESATPPRALLRPDNDWADVKSGLPDNTL